MQARSLRLRYLFPASSLLALLLLWQSIAETHALTSLPSAEQTARVTVWNPFPWFAQTPARAVPSSQKRKKTTLAASITHRAGSVSSTRNLLPAVDKNDIKPTHRQLADTVLRALPSRCRNNLKNFYVRYDNPTSRGLGGKTTIILDGTVPNNEFMALLTHECAHVIHSNLPGNPASGASNFRDGQAIYHNDSPIVSFMTLSWETENVLREGSKPEQFVSGYARADAHEDFAETFAAYVLHPTALEDQARNNPVIAAKREWMLRHLPLDGAVSRSSYMWDGEVPWDVTKLSYSWVGSKSIAAQ